jgi:glucokinase
MKKLLAGDVGATKTILGIYAADKGPRKPLAQATFSSSQYPGLAALVGCLLRRGRPGNRWPGHHLQPLMAH